MEFIRKNWKNLAIGLLCVMFVTKCTSAGNYRRKCAKAVARTEFVTDSLTRAYGSAAAGMDSLSDEIRVRDLEIGSLKSQLDLSKEQNRQLASRRQVITVRADR